MQVVKLCFALAALNWVSTCQAWELRMYSGGKPTDPSKRFSFGLAQRCYSLTNCCDNKSRAADWSGIPADARVAFYTDSQCQGKYAVGGVQSSGYIDFASVNLCEAVSSFMVWQSGMYATAGFTDACHENATVLTADQMSMLTARMS
ncbi:unnamed protein product [Phytophthora lilii]|uniref:Unnamed protein product n=1 Tax=Phytophthora lilii TaxID=2077276 RepID=A0A9W6YK76_9STRA|nr:unnamed protein product [Phytophthora lilii]